MSAIKLLPVYRRRDVELQQHPHLHYLRAIIVTRRQISVERRETLHGRSRDKTELKGAKKSVIVKTITHTKTIARLNKFF